MNLWQNYLRPKTLSEAMDAFAHAPRPLAPIAGGTDLLLDLEQGRHSSVQTLIDVTEIKELLALEIRADSLFIGASVPVNRIVLNPRTGAHAQALTEACELIAGPQVRNVATLGGNVAHALPAADGTIALAALNAEAEIAGFSGNRRIPFQELFVGPGKSSLKHGEELLVGFYLPLSTRHQASCFKRIMRPQGVALPILNCAAWLEREDNAIKDIRIAVGPGGGTPFRATQAEDSLRGQHLNETTSESALESLLAQAQFRTSARRASADYRRHIVSGLFRDTLETAWSRAK
ncbi:MAG: FAD binding domain-containing protein [Chloroflexi bacterium]|nr:FAD binding domain-containing protein [Chloroflexota bacterium]MBI3338788.1 FAD binding domain-containing protein [Chloroflexota bacterium]